ncbi:MAG: glutamyl-tRNA reductase [Magnetospirillum sp.]|nr:glutamyl-tRNA reductase [Magnetospirillum sp.]
MTGPASRFTIIGANHRSASLSLRDALFIDDDAAPGFLESLKERGLRECLMLSTCDRVEVWTAGEDAERAAAAVVSALAARTALTDSGLAPHLYTLTGAEAVRHAFMVTASLDSLVIGEAHVLGQVKAAHRLARDAGSCGPELETLLQAAFSVAKRVRTETPVGEGPVSIAAAAVQLARDLHGDLADCRGLLIGTGDMGELIAENLIASGLSGLAVTAPRQGRAEAVAQALNGHVVPFDEVKDALAVADVVLTSVGSRNLAVTADAVSRALKKRRRKPIFLVDAGIPGDIEPAVNRVDGAFLYDLADLERVALQGRAGREQAARSARAIVDEEVAAFLRGRAARAAVPAIVALRSRFEEVRDAALAEAGGDAAEATRLLVNRLLHAPSEEMKGVAAEGPEWRVMEQTLRKLFRLDE